MASLVCFEPFLRLLFCFFLSCSTFCFISALFSAFQYIIICACGVCVWPGPARFFGCPFAFRLRGEMYLVMMIMIVDPSETENAYEWLGIIVGPVHMHTTGHPQCPTMKCVCICAVCIAVLFMFYGFREKRLAPVDCRRSHIKWCIYYMRSGFVAAAAPASFEKEIRTDLSSST